MVLRVGGVQREKNHEHLSMGEKILRKTSISFSLARSNREGIIVHHNKSSRIKGHVYTRPPGFTRSVEFIHQPQGEGQPKPHLTDGETEAPERLGKWLKVT